MRFALVVLMALTGGGLCAPAVATEPEVLHEHSEFMIRSNPQLSLQQVVAAAVATFPGGAAVRARQEQADVYGAKSRSWQSAPGAITVDHLQSRDAGVTSTETLLGYHWSLWRWGERSAQARYARSLGQLAREERLAWDWQREQHIHDAFARLRLSTMEERAAEQKLAVLRSLAERVHNRVRAGDLPARESDRIRVLLLAAESELLDAQAAYFEAGRDWLQLTGSSDQPADWDAGLMRDIHEEPSAALVEKHPLLRAARAAERAAVTRLEAARARGAGAPLLFVGAREDRVRGNADSGAGYASLTLPLGGAVHARAERSELALAAAQAADALNRAQRTAQWEVHEAFHELAVQREQWAGAQARRQIAEATLEKSLRAFELGENSLLEVSLDQQAQLDARRTADRSLISLQRARARVNSLLGDS